MVDEKAKVRTRRYYVKNKTAILAKRRASNLQKNFGMTWEQWENMFRSQDHRCGICRTDIPTGKTGWCTDHCHVTNRVRGVLCGKCNSGLGLFNDSVLLLESALNYLKRER